MNDCKFCALVASGSVAASLSNVVVETDRAVVAINRRPVSPGHLTLILKCHQTKTSGIRDSDLSGLGSLVGRLSALLEARYRPGRVVFLGDGKRSAHLHWHLIPEAPDVTLDLSAAMTDLNLVTRPATLTEHEVLDLAAGLRQAMGSVS